MKDSKSIFICLLMSICCTLTISLNGQDLIQSKKNTRSYVSAENTTEVNSKETLYEVYKRFSDSDLVKKEILFESNKQNLKLWKNVLAYCKSNNDAGQVLVAELVTKMQEDISNDVEEAPVKKKLFSELTPKEKLDLLEKQFQSGQINAQNYESAKKQYKAQILNENPKN